MLDFGRDPSLSLGDRLSARAAASGADPFLLLNRDRTLSFAEVDRQATALAAALSGLGVDPGDRVALVLHGGAEFVVSWFALVRLGAVAVPLDPGLPGPELRYLLRHSEAVAAVTVEQWQGVDYLELFEGFLPHLPEFQYLVTVGEEDLWYDDRIFQFEDLISSGQGKAFSPPHLDPDRTVAALLHTAGPNGKPKAVELTHASLAAAALGTMEALGIEPWDRVAGFTALHNAVSLAPGILGAVLVGHALVLEETFDADRSLDRAQGTRATVQFGAPTVFASQLQAQRTRPRDLSALRMGVVVGGTMPESLLTEVEAELCPLILSAYALTEAASIVAVCRPGDSDERRRHTVGAPIPGVEIVVLEEGDGVLPVESLGELAVRGAQLMQGYHRQPKATAGAITADGYFRTGDLGILDEEGAVHLVGRQHDVIIRGGSNVHPVEVEDRLGQHPAVEDVGVVGIRDGLLGEAICAAVLLVEGALVTESELKEWCRAGMAEHKVPDRVRFVDSLPTTGTGAIRRGELAREMERFA
jgi:fatty-acyl-CoA synthase